MDSFLEFYGQTSQHSSKYCLFLRMAFEMFLKQAFKMYNIYVYGYHANKSLKANDYFATFIMRKNIWY